MTCRSLSPAARLLLAVLVLIPAWAVAADDDLKAIQDNSFLVEEAYNQEPGIIQHISLFVRDQRSHAWIYTFTQEWPAPSIKHQLSYTIPLASDSGRGIGDVMLNYRYQFVGSGETALAIAPRLSVVLPTGSETKGFGRGHPGLQLAIPVSRVLASRLASHSNLGVTTYSGGGGVDLAAGQSLIYAMNARVQLMTEVVWTETHFRRSPETQLQVSPGIRWAYNMTSGLQIVPGVAFAVGVGPSRGDRSLVGYLSFEHPIGKR